MSCEHVHCKAPVESGRLADAAEAQGLAQPWEVVPYTVLRPQHYFWPSCGWHLGGVAFDRDRGLLYIVQREAFEGRPLVHVFSVNPAGVVFADRFQTGYP